MKKRHEMMAEKHKRAKGGEVNWYAGKDTNVAKEAEEKKHGGKVHKRKKGGEVEGHHSKHRLDKPGRKRGGAIGADQKPLSTAARVKPAMGHKEETNHEDD